MEHLPFFVPLLFVLTTALAVFFLYRATQYSKQVLLLVAVWLMAVGLLALAGFFTITYTLPPRFVLLVAPPLALILALIITPRGKRFLSKLDLKTLTLLHVVRIPVELLLAVLAYYKAVPELMTFEGRNFDLISGLSAPLVYYFGFVQQRLSPRILFFWNVICLLLLINIVTHAVLAAPSPFQQLAFEQPNRAVLYFPFVWLPGFIVPLVLFSHLVALKRLGWHNSPGIKQQVWAKQV